MKKKILSQIAFIACTAFSAAILLICIGIMIVGKDREYGIFPETAFSLFAVCLIISAVGVLLAHANIAYALKYVLHLIVTVASTSVMLAAVNGLNGKTVLVAESMIFVLHTASFVIAVAAAKHKKTEK